MMDAFLARYWTGLDRRARAALDRALDGGEVRYVEKTDLEPGLDRQVIVKQRVRATVHGIAHHDVIAVVA